MARNERLIKASPDTVFRVLSDPRSYAYWVPGSLAVRDAEPGWPQVGTRFHHTVGAGPLRLRDHTEVEEQTPGRYLQLQAKTRPLGKSRVKLELRPAEGGTRVTMIDDPADAATAFFFQPLTHLAMRGRNVLALRRLAELAEGREPIPDSGPNGNGAVLNPLALRRRERLRALLRAR